MYSWHLTVGMHNGQILTGIYKGKENNSADVRKEIIPDFIRSNEHYWADMFSEDEKSQILFDAREVESLQIKYLGEKCGTEI